jgi:hypothetical protein
MPDFKLGYAEKEREMANQRVQDRKTKTGFTRPQSVVHFAVRVAHFHWDELAAGDGNWTAASFLRLSWSSYEPTTIMLLLKYSVTYKQCGLRGGSQ